MREPETRDKQEVETPTSFLVSHLNKTYLPYSGSSAKAALNFLLMEKKKKDEELQSRRDFFKKAAKAALPIVGAIVLANVPSIASAVEKAPLGCETTCSGTCRSNCHYRCTDTCRGRCETTCSGTCEGGCKFTCIDTCKNTNR